MTALPRRLLALPLAVLVAAGCAAPAASAPRAPLAAEPTVAASASEPTPGPATCPPTWTGDRPALSRSAGDLVPAGAIEALLCAYPPTGDQVLPLGEVHRLTSNVGALVEYLNALPAAPGPDTICPAYQATEYVIVLGYVELPPAVVHNRMCALDQGGQARYGFDMNRLTGFWGVPWRHP